MKLGFLVALAIIAALLVQPTLADAADDQVVVSNLRYGIVCGQDNDMRICFQTADIPITGEGHCVFDHQPIACTWYGLSFDYKLPKDEVELKCAYDTNVPVDLGTPKGREGAGVTHSERALTLKQSDGPHYFNPQYSGYSSLRDGSTQELHETCSYNGKTVYDITFKLHIPEE